MTDYSNLYEIMVQCDEDGKRWFGEPVNLTVLCFGLVGEAGEFIDGVKKVMRGSHTMEEVYPGLCEELIDLFVYVCATAATLGIDLPLEYERKREINEQRFGQSNVIQIGSNGEKE